MNFAKDQANGQGKIYNNQKAVDFANRWHSFQMTEPAELKFLFGEKSFNAISHAATELLAFVKDSQT